MKCVHIIFHFFISLAWSLCEHVLWCLQRSMEEVEQMRRERSRVLSQMSSIKRKVAEIQLQEEEVVREVSSVVTYILLFFITLYFVLHFSNKFFIWMQFKKH